ncbi:hypothetical protein QEN19_003679 [Hanseniaspora menglaensis]
MKVLTSEEIELHNQAAHIGMLKGGLAGGCVSILGAGIAKWKFKKFVKLSNWQIKTALFVTPIAFGASFWGEESSTKFGKQLYSGTSLKEEKLEELKRWNQLTLEQKTFHTLNENKFSVLFGSWAATLYGSWRHINKDKFLTQSQKIVQARMYAQFLTIVLVFGVLGITYYDQIVNPQDFAEENQESRLDKLLAKLDAQEKANKDIQTNEQRLDAKIFKYGTDKEA